MGQDPQHKGRRWRKADYHTAEKTDGGWGLSPDAGAPGSPTPSPGLVYRGQVLFGVVSHVHLGYMRCLCRGLGRMDRARLYLGGQEQNINCLDNSCQAARRDCRLRSERPNHTRRGKKNRKLRLVKQQERQKSSTRWNLM